MKQKSLRLFVVVAVALALVFAAGVNPSVTYAQGQGYTSGIQVQNLDAGPAAITLTFYNQDGSTANQTTDTIPGNDSKTYFQATLTAPSGFSGAAVISSDKPLASISNVLKNNNGAGAAYVGSNAGSTSVNLPLLMKNNAGFNSWFSLQNAGSATAAVTVSYSDGTSASASIPVGAARVFNQATENHNLAAFSASISSDQPVVAVAVQERPANIAAYNGFTSGSTNPVMPLVNANNAGFVTGIQIQNTGGTPTDVTVTYTSPNAPTCTETQSIGANASATFALAAFTDDGICGGGRFVGSARVTGNTGNHPLAAIVNQLDASGSRFAAYGSFDPANATTTVKMPLIMDRNGGYFTGFSIMNVSSGPTTVNCTFTESGVTVSQTLAAGVAFTSLQNNQLAPRYIGSATCTAGANIVGVVNELGSGGTDQFLVYEGFNTGN